MAEAADVRIEGCEAVVRLGGHAAIPPGEPVTVEVADAATGDRFPIGAGVRRDEDGLELVLPLPTRLFDGDVHRLTLSSRAWDPALEVTVAAMDEDGIPIPARGGVEDGAPAGKVEYFDGEVVRGWVYNPNMLSDRVRVDLFIDNVRYASVLADERRNELVRRGIGDGRYGFSKALPTGVLDGRRHVIGCFVADSMASLDDGIIDLDVAELRRFLVDEIVRRINRLERLFD